jgi:glutamate synthase (NADPH/NADH) small chain
VIIAASQEAESNLVSSTKGMDANRSGLLVADADGRTSRPGVFAAGDVHIGQSLVVRAIAEGKAAAKEVDEYLMGYSSL